MSASLSQANPLSQANGGVLACTVHGEAMAIAAAEVAEIMRVPACTRVPNAPAALVGIASLRGTVFPVISLAALLGHDGGTATGAASRVVVLAGAEPVGLLVDAVGALSAVQNGKLLDPRTLLLQDFGSTRRKAPPPLAGAAEVTPAPAHDVLSLIELMLAAQAYALPVDKVAEVMRVPAALPPVPHTDDAMLGVAAFRGGLLPVVSLRVLLGLPAGAPGPATRIVVAAVAGLRVGLLVDGVAGTLVVPADNVDPVPPVLLRGRGEAQLEGICRLDGGRRLVCLLSPARLFDEETAARIRVHGDQEVSRMSGSDPLEGGATRQFVVFSLNQEQYGVPIEAVLEVVRRPDVLTRMPHAPEFVAGVMNLRGRAVPVVDAALRFGTPAAEGRSRRVVVLLVDGVRVGFAVEAVTKVLSVPVAALRPAPVFEDGRPALFDHVAIEDDGRMVLLISPRGLLLQAESDMLAALADMANAEAQPAP